MNRVRQTNTNHLVGGLRLIEGISLGDRRPHQTEEEMSMGHRQLIRSDQEVAS
jgi:hypothetical protein